MKKTSPLLSAKEAAAMARMDWLISRNDDKLGAWLLECDVAFYKQSKDKESESIKSENSILYYSPSYLQEIEEREV